MSFQDVSGSPLSLLCRRAQGGTHTAGRRYLHARAKSLQVSKVQALPAGVQTLHHTVRLHAARTHRHTGQQAVVAAHVLHYRPETVAP